MVVKNTFATPYCQRPLQHGVDIVVHSLTKDVGGFGSEMGGAVIGSGTYLCRWQNFAELRRAVCPVLVNFAQRELAHRKMTRRTGHLRPATCRI